MGDGAAGVMLGAAIVVGGTVVLYVVYLRQALIVAAQAQTTIELNRYVGTWPDELKRQITGEASRAVGAALNNALP